MGRRPVIFIAAIFSLIPMIGCAVSQNWVQLLICRLLLGVGMGCKAAVGEQIQASEECSHSNKMAVPIYAAETAPTTIRGKSRDSSKELGSKYPKLV
jgi:MFS family permease